MTLVSSRLPTLRQRAALQLWPTGWRNTELDKRVWQFCGLLTVVRNLRNGSIDFHTDTDASSAPSQDSQCCGI